MKKPSFAILFFTLIGILASVTLLKPTQTVSEREQRTLNPFPPVSLNAIREGQFQAQGEKALSDQFFLRAGFVQLQRHFQQLLGMRIINGVWIGEHQLYQNSDAADAKTIQQYSELLNRFALQNPKLRFDFLLVPTANGVIENPKFSMLYTTQRKTVNNFIKALNSQYHAPDTLMIMDRKKDEYLYYKGDHHWTVYGAYTMFQEWQKQRGLKDHITYEPMVVNDAFYGTLSNASGIDERDIIEIYRPKQNDIHAVITYVQEQKRTTSVYDETKQYSANPYEIFFGGNFARMDIQTTAKNDRSLLVIKDSYANCFIPFLLPHYHKIIVIDPRFYYDSLQTLIKTDYISDVLFLMNADTMFQDTSLYSLLKEEMNDK